MNQSLVYHVSQMVVGGGLLLLAVSMVLVDGVDDAFEVIVAGLMGIGGCGVALANGYQLLQSDTDPVDRNPAAFWLSVVAAGLMVVGAILQLAG